jgi:hypothetical protein
MKSEKERSCIAVKRIARKPPNAIEIRVRILRRLFRQRFLHAILAKVGPFIANTRY